eukprot:3606723-Amphidinium_carterae.1
MHDLLPPKTVERQVLAQTFSLGQVALLDVLLSQASHGDASPVQVLENRFTRLPSVSGIKWHQQFHTKLQVAIEVSVRVEPQEALQHLVNTVQQVCFNDMKTNLTWHTLTDDTYSMTSEFSLNDVLRMTSDFAVELKLRVQRKRQTQAVNYNLNAAIQDVEPEKGDEDPAPRKPSSLCAALQSDKGCPDGGNCSTVKRGGHPFLKGKCLNCSSMNHLKATCNRPFANTKDLEAELEEQQEDADDQDEDQADDDQSRLCCR